MGRNKRKCKSPKKECSPPKSCHDSSSSDSDGDHHDKCSCHCKDCSKEVDQALILHKVCDIDEGVDHIECKVHTISEIQEQQHGLLTDILEKVCVI